MSYTTLVAGKTTSGSIKEWVNYDLIPSASVLTKAEGMIYQHMRAREMKALATGTISSTNTTMSLSALRFLEPIVMKLTGSSGGPVDILDADHFERRLHIDDDGDHETGTPTVAMVLGETMHFDVAADQDYNFRLVYVQRPAALSGSNETNFLTDRYPHILEAACLKYAFAFMKNTAESQNWERQTMQFIDQANNEAGMYMGALRYEKFWEQ